MLRLAVVFAVAAALLAPSAASGQQQQPPNPFGPLPQSAPTPAPTPQSVDDPNDDDVGRTTLYVIAGALLIAFVAVGVFISRDARRSVPKDERRDRSRLREDGPHRHKRQAKEKSRARVKAQRAARRRNR